MSDKNAAIRHHDALATGWDARYRSGGFKRRAQFFLTDVITQVQVGGHWLDAGCGAGTFSRSLVSAGAQVTGVDGSGAMIREAQALSGNGHVPSLVFQQIETVEKLPFAAQTFDGLISLSVLEYVPNPEAALTEYARVLRAGAPALLSLPNTASLTRAAARVARVFRPHRIGGNAYLDSSDYTVRSREIRPLLRRHGLVVRKTWTFDPLLPRWLGALTPSLFFVYATRTAEPLVTEC